MITRESKKSRLNLKWVAVAVLAVVFVASAFAQEEPVVEEPLLDEELELLPEDPQMPGTIEGTGTYFEVTDSEYLNIVFQSSEPVHLTLESVPQMVVMEIEATEGASSTWITLSGFAPSTTYYKYEDDYHNEVAFTTDASGTYTFAQDLSEPHLVFIQPQAGTKFIRDDATGGDATSIGTWDWPTKTCTLTQDVYETIQIDSDGITLDGAGHTVTGSYEGVFLRGRTGVTIKNLNVQGFRNGIHLRDSSDNTLTDNTASNNDYGIYLYRSGGSTLTGNSMSGNRYNFRVAGTADAHFANSIDTSNTVDGKPVYYVVNGVGGIYDSSTNAGVFYAINCNGITIKDLSLTNNYEGVYLWNTHNSSIENVGSLNNGIGIYLRQSNGNNLTGNTTSNNLNYGILLYYSSGSTLTGNSMSGNRYNFRVGGTTDAHFANSIDTSNTVEGKPVYYVVNGVGGIYDSSTNAGVFYAINCNGITIKGLSLTNNYEGVYLWNTHNSSIENVDASNNYSGISLYSSSSNNTLTGNTVNSNRRYGIHLRNSSDNTLTGNTVNWNGYEIFLRDSSSNQVYNNNFIDNDRQARVSGGIGNLFNLAAPIGGNYWSDWTSPDADNDGFVDEPYVFDGGQDNLPWVVQNGWNQPPVVGAIIAPLEPVQVDTIVAAGALFSDPDTDDTHTASWNWGDGSTSAGTVDEENGTVTGTHTYTTPGVYTVTLTVTDEADASDEAVFQYIVVYDPSAGFVTGGGWIASPPGAYTADPSLTGKANFGFVAKYKKGATVPTGNTEFKFKAGDLNFHSSSYQWLVVNQGGTNAQFKGSGTINGEMDPNGKYYRFMLWAGDGEPDTFRIRIWEEDEVSGDESDVYDNGFDQIIGGGSIVVHAK